MLHDEQRVDQLKRESLPELLRELSLQTTTLVRQEIQLATTELTAKAKAAGFGAAILAVAALLAVGAAALLTTCVVVALALVLPLWAAALIVAVLYGIAALIVAQMGTRTLKTATPAVPRQAAQSVKEDVQWLKTRAQSSTKSS
jgi:uncharacterized membrane protein YqjE